MARGNRERAWTYKEYVEKYEQLRAEVERLTGLFELAYGALKGYGVVDKDVLREKCKLVFGFIEQALKEVK